jgi:adenylylsulfate kinase
MPVLWITGLAGSGKSTLARAVVAQLRCAGHVPLLLDGDQVREALEHGAREVSHEPQQRQARAWRLARLAALAAQQGVPVVVATVSLQHEVQRWNRAHNARFAEVVLSAPLAALAVHRPDLYGSGGGGPAANVVGLDIPAEFPVAPELSLQQDYTPDSLASAVQRCVELWDRLLRGKA